jgi:hypothetical protein
VFQAATFVPSNATVTVWPRRVPVKTIVPPAAGHAPAQRA